MSNDRPPMTDAEAAAYLDSLDRLYGRLQSIDSRAETLLADARSLGDEEAVARIEAILTRLGEALGANYGQPGRASRTPGTRRTRPGAKTLRRVDL